MGIVEVGELVWRAGDRYMDPVPITSASVGNWSWRRHVIFADVGPTHADETRKDHMWA